MAKKRTPEERAKLGKGLAALLKDFPTKVCDEDHKTEKINPITGGEKALVEYSQQKNLNPVDLAIAYNSLRRDFGLNPEEIANRVGKRRSAIANYLRLLKLPPNIQEALRSNDITYRHAKILGCVNDILLQQDLFNKVKEHSLSVHSTEMLLQKYRH